VYVSKQDNYCAEDRVLLSAGTINMKISCKTCCFFHEDYGDYYESYYDCDCSQAGIGSIHRRYELHTVDRFPFDIAPGCWRPNPDLMPNYIVPEFNVIFDDINNYYDRIKLLTSEWYENDGQQISLCVAPHYRHKSIEE